MSSPACVRVASARSFPMNLAKTCAGGPSRDRPGSTCSVQTDEQKKPGQCLARQPASNHDAEECVKWGPVRFAKGSERFSHSFHRLRSGPLQTRRSNASSGTTRLLLSAGNFDQGSTKSTPGTLHNLRPKTAIREIPNRLAAQRAFLRLLRSKVTILPRKPAISLLGSTP